MADRLRIPDSGTPKPEKLVRVQSLGENVNTWGPKSGDTRPSIRGKARHHREHESQPLPLADKVV